MRNHCVDKRVYFTALIFLFSRIIMAQVGISVSPPRIYYHLAPGETGSQKVLISNVSKNHPLNISLTFGDWRYDEHGNNVMLPPDSLGNSCVGWLSIPSGTYIILEPGENREVDVLMTVPASVNETVQTAILYATQMNPVDGVNAQGAAIKINVRQGIKIYRKDNTPEKKQIEIENFTIERKNNCLLLTFKNKGNIWINGTVNAGLFNQTNGKETSLKKTLFYTMPNDRRIMPIPLPEGLAQGRYMATVILDYGDDSTIEAAELEFSHE